MYALTLEVCAAASAAQEAAWRQALAQLHFSAFVLEFERLECWRLPRERAHVLRPAPGAALDALQHRTAALARAAGIALPARCWKPHLTLLRAAPPETAPVALPPLRWTGREVVLVRSDLQLQPARYTVLGRFGAP